jgi:hypothetical protein
VILQCTNLSNASGAAPTSGMTRSNAVQDLSGNNPTKKAVSGSQPPVSNQQIGGGSRASKAASGPGEFTRAAGVLAELRSFSAESLWDNRTKSRKIDSLTTVASQISSKLSDECSTSNGASLAMELLTECERVDSQHKLFTALRASPAGCAHSLMAAYQYAALSLTS